MNYKKSLKPFFKKRYLVEIASIVVLLILATVFKITVDNLKDAGNSGSNLATLAVNFDNLKRSFEGEVAEDMTVLDALNMAMAVGKIKLNYALDEKNQVRVMEINDHLNKVGNKHFAFFLNDKQISSENLNKTKIKPGDSVVIRYE